MTRELGKYIGETRYWSALVSNQDKFKSKQCLSNVQCITGLSQDEHVWVDSNRKLVKGSYVTFKATVEEYIRPQDNSRDYKLVNVKEVKVINENI